MPTAISFPRVGLTAHDPTNCDTCFCPACRGDGPNGETRPRGRLQEQVRQTLRRSAPASTASLDAPPVRVSTLLRCGSPNEHAPYMPLGRYLLSGGVPGWFSVVHPRLWVLFENMLNCLDMNPADPMVTIKPPELRKRCGIQNRGTFRKLVAILEHGTPACRARRGRAAAPPLPPLFDRLPNGAWRGRLADFELLIRYARATLGHEDLEQVMRDVRLRVRSKAATVAHWGRSGRPRRADR